MLNGRCECQAVCFEVDSGIEEFSHCHCSQCRRLHGGAFATFAAVRQSAFRYTAGQEAVKQYASSDQVTRHFCGVCGSMIMSGDKSDDEVFYLSMSILEGTPVHPSGYHEHVASKADWFAILDDLPQYPKGIVV